MKRFTEEDLREYLVVALISVGLFLLFVLTPINPILHEAGHSLICSLQGGTWMAEPTQGGYHTVCKGVSQWTGQDALNFYLSGIGTEVFLGLGLMLAPFFSLLGALIFTNTGVNMLFGHYATDLQKTCKVAPNLCFLQNPAFHILFIGIGFVLLGLSLVYTRRMVKKLNLFGPL